MDSEDEGMAAAAAGLAGSDWSPAALPWWSRPDEAGQLYGYAQACVLVPARPALRALQRSRSWSGRGSGRSGARLVGAGWVQNQELVATPIADGLQLILAVPKWYLALMLVTPSKLLRPWSCDHVRGVKPTSAMMTS